MVRGLLTPPGGGGGGGGGSWAVELRKLCLAGMPLEAESLGLLGDALKARLLPALEELSVKIATAAGLTALMHPFTAAAPSWQNTTGGAQRGLRLTSLTLWIKDNDRDDGEASRHAMGVLGAALAGPDAAPCLKTLLIMWSKCRYEGLQRMLERMGERGAVGLGGLTWLSLCNCSMGAKGVTAVVAMMKACPLLEELDLSANQLGDLGFVELCEGLRRGCAPSLRTLLINAIGLTDVGALSLLYAIESKAVPRLATIRAMGNPGVSEEVVKARVREGSPRVSWNGP